MCCGDDVTTQTTELPSWQSDYYQWQIGRQQDQYGRAQQLYDAQSQYPLYPGQRIAGFNADQNLAFQLARNSAGIGAPQLDRATQLNEHAAQGYGQTFTANTLNPALIRSSDVAQASSQGYTPAMMQAASMGDVERMQGEDYDPERVSNTDRGYAANTIDPTRLNQERIGALGQVGSERWDTGAANAYMNPYVDTALRSTLDEMTRQNDQQRLADQGRAAKAGAFGGSRHGIIDAERDRNLTRAMADTTAQAMNQAYGQAQNQFNADAGRSQQASTTNVANDLERQKANQGLGIQALLSDQSAVNRASEFGAGQVLQADLANQQAGNRASEFGIGQRADASRFNIGNQMTRNEVNARFQQEAGANNQNASNTASAFGADAANRAAEANAQRHQQALMTNTQNLNSFSALNEQNRAAAFNTNREQFNTERDNAGSAAQLFGQLATTGQQHQLTGANAIMNAGNAQQNLAQQNMNLGYQDFQQQRQYPWQQLSNLQGALRVQPMNGGGTTTTTSPGPSAAQTIGGLGIAALGAAGAAGGFGNLFTF